MRLPWLGVGFANGLLWGGAAVFAGPVLADFLARRGGSPILQSFLSSNFLVVAAIFLGVMVVALVFFGCLVPAVLFRRSLGQFGRRLVALRRSGEGLSAHWLDENVTDEPLWDGWRRYAEMGMSSGQGDVLVGPEGADVVSEQVELFASERLLADDAIQSRFYRILPPVLIGIGLVMLMLGMVAGLDKQLLTSGNALGFDSTAKDVGLLQGLFALAIVTVLALTGWGIYALGMGLLRARAREITQLLRIAATDGYWTAVIARVDDTTGRITGSLDALRTQAAEVDRLHGTTLERIAADQRAGVAEMMRQSVSLFVEQLNKALGEQQKAVAESMAMLDRQTRTAGESIARVQDTLARESERHGQKLAKAAREGMEAARLANKEQIDAALAALRVTSEQLPVLVSRHLDTLSAEQARLQASAEVLTAAVQRESHGAQEITAASEQLAATAAVSRETVERFITLAERLRDVNRAARMNEASGGEAILTDPSTTRRLSSAIRDLQRAAEQTLPEF